MDKLKEMKSGSTNKNKTGNGRTMSKYGFIKSQILGDIENSVYCAGDKIPSENELCEKYNSSRITVRKALDELTMEDILERVQGVGTFVKTRKPRVPMRDKVILVIPYIVNAFPNSIVEGIIRGLEEVFGKEGILFFEMMEPTSANGRERFVQALNELSPMGIIYLFYYSQDVQAELVKLGCPVVFVDTEPEENMFDVVKGDDYRSAYRATQMLLSSGRKNIGFFSSWSNRHRTCIDRLKGVRDAVMDNGAHYDKRFYYFSPELSGKQTHNEALRMDAVEEAVKYFEAHQCSVDGIVAFNDTNAKAILEASEEFGIKVPEDLAIISYGNYYKPEKLAVVHNLQNSVTSYEQNFYEYGRSAAELMVKRIRRELPQVQQRRTISYELIRKESF